jgi:hypothetical protein
MSPIGTSGKWCHVRLSSAKGSRSDIDETSLASLDLRTVHGASFGNRAWSSSKEGAFLAIAALTGT